MKKVKILATLLTVGVAAFVAHAVLYSQQSFLKGTVLRAIQPASATALSVANGSTTSGTADWTNNLGQLITVGTNSIGITYGSWDQPANLYSDANGAAAVTAFAFHMLTNSATTNTIAFTFNRSPDGVNWDTTTTFSYTSPANPGGLTLVTNLPTWLVTGAKQLRVNMSFATNGVACTNIVDLLALTGHIP